MPDHKTIPTSNGPDALVSLEDYNFLSQWKWKQHTQGYVCRTGYDHEAQVHTCILMHRLVMDAPDDMEVHHINENKMDNRRSNLELIDPTEHRLKHIDPLIQSAKDRQIYPDYKDCANCGTRFKVNPRKRKRNKCCSHECAQEIRVQAALEARGLA